LEWVTGNRTDGSTQKEKKVTTVQSHNAVRFTLSVGRLRSYDFSSAFLSVGKHIAAFLSTLKPLSVSWMFFTELPRSLSLLPALHTLSLWQCGITLRPYAGNARRSCW